MKKIILTSVCALAVTGAAFAQGNVNWLTISAAAMTAHTNSTTYSPLFGGGAVGSGAVGVTAVSGSFYYALLYSSFSGVQATPPSSVAGLASWTATGLTAVNNTTTAGRLVTVGGSAGAQVPWSPGVTNSIMLVGWSANLGTTWTAALASLNAPGTIVGQGFFGQSATGYITTLSTSTSPGSAVFGTAPTVQGIPINSLNTQLYLVPTPEPGTLALAALGGASLLMFRRRNSK